jgi:hypothetical protein
MRASLAVPLAALACIAALSGCLGGAFHAASIPSPPSGWSYDSDHSEGGEQGNAVVKVQYRVNQYKHSAEPFGGAAVISVGSVPFVDIQAEIKKRLDAYIAENGIELTQTGAGATTLRGDKADYVLYDAQRSGVHGRAIDVKYTCGANGEAVRVFAYAATETVLLLRQQDAATWLGIVGSDPPGDPAGGLLSGVACS